MQRGLLARHAPDDLVAFGAAGERTARVLLHDVAVVARTLPSAPKGAETPLVIRNDRYALAVSILAAWSRDYVVVLPPEHDRDAITTLADAPATVCVLHDTVSGIPLQVSALLGRALEDGAFERDAWTGRVLQSRTYGRDLANKLVPERWGEDWLQQARALSELTALMPGQRCATSVGPGHVHGVVLGVLLPLLTGAAFLREPLAARALGAQLEAQAIDVVVSVPAHVPELLEGAAGHRDTRSRRVISALGPLSPSLRAQLSEALGAEVSDLAHAAQQVPVLHCTDDPQPGATQLETLMQARLEQFVRSEAGVRDAAAVHLSAVDGARMYVAVIGEKFDVTTLRTKLDTEGNARAKIELLAVSRIRRDGIGRARRNELLRQFGLRPDGAPVNFRLQWSEPSTQRQSDAVEHRASVCIPGDYAYYDGHFPGYPILAGAAQLNELILPLVRRVRPDLGRLAQMSRLKFSGRIQPGETIDVALTSPPDATALDFSLRRGTVVCSTGTLSFVREDAA